MNNKTSNKMIDIIKFIASILIVGSHSLPLFREEVYNFFYGQWLFRFCVPFFMMVTGYFFANMDDCKQRKQIKRVLLIYIISTMLYYPLILRDANGTILYWIRTIIFGYFHLWYLIAIVIGLILWYVLNNVFKRNILIIAISFMLLGIVLDEYYVYFNFSLLKKYVFFLNTYLGGARNVFFAFPMLYLGKVIRDYENKLKEISYKKLWIIMLVIIIFSYVEVLILLNKVGYGVTFDISIFGWIPAVILLILAIKTNFFIKEEQNNSKLMSLMLDKKLIFRKTSIIIYIVHPICLYILTSLGFQYIQRFLFGALMSIMLSLFVIL